jgi:cystathionine beta-lyase/cystathionine gamma-synthase
MEPLTDTRKEITALQYRLLRQASPARKLAMLGEMNQTVKTLMYSGLRSRYPTDSAEKLHRRLADLILGPELAQRVYGPLFD